MFVAEPEIGLLEDVEGFAAVVCDGGFESEVFELLLQHALIDGVVFDDEDGDLCVIEGDDGLG